MLSWAFAGRICRGVTFFSRSSVFTLTLWRAYKGTGFALKIEAQFFAYNEVFFKYLPLLELNLAIQLTMQIVT